MKQSWEEEGGPQQVRQRILYDRAPHAFPRWVQLLKVHPVQQTCPYRIRDPWQDHLGRGHDPIDHVGPSLQDIRCVPRLSTLRCNEDPADDEGAPCVGDIFKLDSPWTGLRELVLENFDTEEGDFVRLLTGHARTLRKLRVEASYASRRRSIWGFCWERAAGRSSLGTRRTFDMAGWRQRGARDVGVGDGVALSLS